MHQVLYEKDPGVFDIEEIGKLFKVQLKGKTPPCVITFKCEGEENKRVDLRVYYSDEYREPSVDSNHDSMSYVSEIHSSNFLSVAYQEQDYNQGYKDIKTGRIHERLGLLEPTIDLGLSSYDKRVVQIGRQDDVQSGGGWSRS